MKLILHANPQQQECDRQPLQPNENSLIGNATVDKQSNRLIQPESRSYYAGCRDNEPNAPIPQGQIKLWRNRFYFSIHAQTPRQFERRAVLGRNRLTGRLLPRTNTNSAERAFCDRAVSY
jgi:hypothetical protein